MLDRDLQIVVNGLWAAGAEAIAINGQRLTARSAIRSAGQAILVDFRPLVAAVRRQRGRRPGGLQTRFAAGSAGAYLRALRDNYGIRAAIVSSREPRAAGGRRLLHARAVHAGGAASATPVADRVGDPARRRTARRPARPRTTTEVSP